LLARRDRAVLAIIDDDGRGFDSSVSEGDGIGLLGMHERVDLHNGRLTVESTPGVGTTLRVEVPL
jgi:two-component system sensor histidine kinase DegS